MLFYDEERASRFRSIILDPLFESIKTNVEYSEIDRTHLANLTFPPTKQLKSPSQLQQGVGGVGGFVGLQMANPVVRVRRETIAACMTCPLCDKLFRDATTISECLHTFCRKCIYNKISDEELEVCPICNIDLGCVPLEKLRPDHSWQDVRAKIFPFKRRKVSAPEVMPSVTLPARRKERSLSSLVVSTPRVSAQATMTGRRTKAVARKASALQASSFLVERPIKNEEGSAEDHLESNSSPEASNKSGQNNKPSSFSAEPSQPVSNKETEDSGEPWEGKLDLWKPLNCLVEVANRTKSLKSNSQGSENKVEPVHVIASEPQVRKSKNKENKQKSKVEEEKNSTYPTSPETVKPKKLRRVRRKRESFAESSISPQAVLDATFGKHERRAGPIWFSLVASEDQEGDEPLPQIPTSYLRIKDGNVPVSFIQKYLMRKLDLTSEAEVEIKCMGQPVVPTLEMYNLVDLWLQMASPSERITASVGSSAKDFVMVLAYSRKLNAGVLCSPGTVHHNREQPTFGSFLLVGIQIIRPPKRSVQPNNREPNQNRYQHVQPHVREDQSHDGDDSESPQNDAVIDDSVENYERFVAEEVEEEPGDEDEEEDDEGDGVPKEAEEEDEEDKHRVVHAEVAEVALDSDGGFAKGVGAREAGEGLNELEPWAARGEEGLGRGPGAREWFGHGGGEGGGGGWECAVAGWRM
ncbi:E3 ubiquitin protein ligase DRIP2-like [Pyrus ussuriensis x Pyrus communis]|uniref:E3 ubiquitin protein ligase DRIP2-like n=1 Tax=Pyrus ussuriensis x Pyrus communis TaxID=2448454 RepID=A0A5N5IAF5_9ROSA|nr:E3 ubiquitin protein ligase DRIP2-like [Pyrus ussuriensis x Pyrus communis]